MTLQRMTVFCVALIACAMFAGVSCADTIIAGDSSSDLAYASNVTTTSSPANSVVGIDGGTGFGAWTTYYGAYDSLFVVNDLSGASYTPVLDDGTAFFVDGAVGKDHHVPARILDNELAAGDTLSVTLKKEKDSAGSSNTFGANHWIGFFLYDSDYFNSKDVRIKFGSATEAGSNWCIWNDDNGTVLYDTQVSADDTAIRVGFTVTGTDTYDFSIEVWDEVTGQFGVATIKEDLVLSSATADSGGGSTGPLDCFRVYNMGDCGDLLFNNLAVTAAAVPEPGVLSLLAGLAFFGLWIKRR